MKRSITYLAYLLLLATMVVSCKNSAVKEAKYLPKETSFVLAVDPQQLKDKLQLGGINVDTLLKRIFKNDSADVKDKAFIEDLRENAGIKWSEKLFLFIVQKNNPDNSLSTAINLLGSLEDDTKLTTFLKKQPLAKGKDIKNEKDFSYISSGDGTLLAWNKEQIIATIYQHPLKAVYDTVAMTFKKPTPINTEAEIIKEVGLYFTQKTNESLADVDKFTKLFAEKSDGYSFSSGNSALGGLSMIPLQIPKLEELVKDNYLAATLRFEDGKIIAKSDSYTNELLSSVLKKYAGPTVDLSLLEKYPSQNINGIFLAAFNPEIFSGILKQLEVEALANDYLEKTGFSLKDVYGSLKGDISVIVSDIGVAKADPMHKSDERSMMNNKTFGKMLFIAPVGNKASFTKIMNKAVENGIFVKQKNVYKAGGLASFLGLYFYADDKNLVIASDSITYANFLANKAPSNINKETLQRFKGKSTIFYVDIANTLNNLISDSTASYFKTLKTAKATFKDVIATSDNFNGKSVEAVFELRLQNEKQNSLVTLTGLFTDIAKDMRLDAKRDKVKVENIFTDGVPAIIRSY